MPKDPYNHGLHSQSLAGGNVTLSPALQAFSRTGKSVQGLRRIIATAHRRDVQSAAVALEVARSSLNFQLKRIEEAAGFTIIERSRPLSVPQGDRGFLIDAERLLTLLDGKAHREPVTSPQRRETVR